MLHTPTLMLALLLAYLLLTLHLGLVQRGVVQRGAAWANQPIATALQRWSLGCWASLAGLLALVVHHGAPPVLAWPLGEALLCLGLALYVQALYRLLRDAPAPSWVMAVQPMIWLALLLGAGWPPHQRAMLLSLVFVVLLAPGVLVIRRHGWDAERALRTVAGLLAAAGAALLLRAVHAGLGPEPQVPAAQADAVQGLSFLFAFLCLVGAGISFVRVLSDRQQAVGLPIDRLTGCWSRHSTDTLLAHELLRARRAGAPLAFALLELDHLRQINAQHGPATGDQVLQALAQTVRGRLRASDVLGRTGGAEFALLLPDTHSAGARWLMEDIRRRVEALAPPTPQGTALRLTVSVGLAVADAQSSLSSDRLYGHADQSLYEARRAGCNRVEVYGISAGATELLPLD